MSVTKTKLSDFPGFYVQYDPKADPFFKAIVVENLRTLASVPIGFELLKLIKDARPKSRGKFPSACNVMVSKQQALFIQSGYKKAYTEGVLEHTGLAPSANPAHSPDGCPFHSAGSGSLNASVDPVAAENGTGSVCNMLFTNTQIRTSKGETAYPFIVLAHELIHSYHCLYGIKRADTEELWATGLREFSDERLSENKFRRAFGLSLRTEY